MEGENVRGDALSASAHFMQRVRERIGPHVDPVSLAERIVDAILFGCYGDVVFITRANKEGCRVFRFTEDGRVFYALVDTDQMRCVTVLPPSFVLGREGRGPLVLREVDL